MINLLLSFLKDQKQTGEMIMATLAVRPQTDAVVVQASSLPGAPPASSSWMGRAWNVYTNAMDEGGTFLKSVFRLTNATTFWAKYFNPSTPNGVSDLGGLAKQAKNLTSVFGLPQNLAKVVETARKFDIAKPFTSTANLGADVCSLANGGCDTAELVHTVVTPLPADLMEKVKATNYTATFLGSLKGTYDTVVKLFKNATDIQKNEADKTAQNTSEANYQKVKAKTTQQVTSNVLSLASKVSYLALGSLGIASLFTPLAPAAIVACLTSGTIFGLGSFFYDRVVDPFDDKAKKLAQNPLFEKAAEIKAKTA